MSNAGTSPLVQFADKLGLTRALSTRLAGLKQRRRGHDPGRVIRDLAVMLADGGECVSDLGGVREQEAPFGSVAFDSTAFRTVEKIATTPRLLDALRAAHARARARFWELRGAPERLTIDVDATLITAHSEKEKAAWSYKHGYGFHPLGAYADETREALSMLLRPGNAGSNTAADHVTVIDPALASSHLSSRRTSRGQGSARPIAYRGSRSALRVRTTGRAGAIRACLRRMSFDAEGRQPFSWPATPHCSCHLCRHARLQGARLRTRSASARRSRSRPNSAVRLRRPGRPRDDRIPGERRRVGDACHGSRVDCVVVTPVIAELWARQPAADDRPTTRPGGLDGES